MLQGLILLIHTDWNLFQRVKNGASPPIRPIFCIFLFKAFGLANSVFAGDSHGADSNRVFSNRSWAEKANSQDVSKVLLIESAGLELSGRYLPPLATGKQVPVRSMKAITSREKRILELIGQGYSTSQIALALQISSHTVETYRKSLLIKFDARNAAELVRKAIQLKALSIGTRIMNKPKSI